MKPPAAALAALLVACAATPARDDGWNDHASRLAGDWSVQLRLAGNTPREVAGRMTLTRNGTVDRVLPEIGLPTDYGTYDIDFHALGRQPSGGLVPGVFAGVSADSVVIIFETDRADFSMTMRAPIADDSIRGAWTAIQSRNTVGTGTFLMTRNR